MLLPGEPPQARSLVLLTLHDLTPIRRVEEMRADFVANASHELRTPLASLSGFIETLQGPANDAPARAFPRHHEDAGDAHGAADRRLLSLSRIELKVHLQPDIPSISSPLRAMWPTDCN